MAEIGTAGTDPYTNEIQHPQDAITILCQLQSEVQQNVLEYKHAGDCFCGNRDKWVEEGKWLNEGIAIQFIIDATRAAMEASIYGREFLMIIPKPVVEPLGVSVNRDALKMVWDSYVQPTQDERLPPSTELRILMAVLRAVYEGLDE